MDTITVTLTAEQAQRMRKNLIDAIDYHEAADTERGDELAGNMAEIFEEIDLALQRKDAYG